MPIYSMPQLVGKTIFLKVGTPYYTVNSINQLGYKANPIGKAISTMAVVIDSYLTVAPERISNYGIKYAERKDDYLLFYSGGVYMGVKLSEIGKQSDYLSQQGSLTVEEEIKKRDEEANAGFLDDLLGGNLKGIGKGIKTILILVIIIIGAYYLLPLITKLKK